MNTAELKSVFRALGWKGKFRRLAKSLNSEGKTLYILISPAPRPIQDATIIYMNEAVWEKGFHDLVTEIGGFDQEIFLVANGAKTRPEFEVIDDIAVKTCDAMIMEWAKNLSYRQMLIDWADRNPEHLIGVQPASQLASMVILGRRRELEEHKAGVIKGRFTKTPLAMVERAVEKLGIVATV